jgi:5-exo-hydroxycamphor dehydrogenase
MAVVELVTSGICGTDVHIWEGALAMPRPVIPGHEFLGRVSALGADAEARDCMGEPVKVGDLVAVNVIEPCGKCLLCRTGGAASCLFLGESLTYTRSPDEPPHLYGGYAEATVCPIRYLHRLPDGLAPEVAAAFLCAGPTVIRAVTYGGGIGSREHVVVQGSGPVGLFATLWASHCGAASVTLIGSSSHPDRLVLARRLGATSVLDIRSTSEEQRRQTVFGITDGIGADVVIECSGSPNAVPEGLGLLRPRGRYLLPGQYSDRGPVPLPIHLVTLNALQLIGSAQFTSDDRQAYFAGLMQMSDRWDAITASITLRAPVSKADSALQAVRQGKAIKALLVPE